MVVVVSVVVVVGSWKQHYLHWLKATENRRENGHGSETLHRKMETAKLLHHARKDIVAFRISQGSYAEFVEPIEISEDLAKLQ